MKERSVYGVTPLLICLCLMICGVLADSMSSGGYSSSGSTSFDSSKGLSTSSVTTISSPQRTTGQVSGNTAAPGPGIPPTWVLDVNTASFFDTATTTAWVYDRILKKFYCPANGWFLVTLFSQSPSRTIAYEQYYYNPVTGEFFSIVDGAKITQNLLATRSPVQSGTMVTPSVQVDTGQPESPTIVSSSNSMESTTFGGLNEEGRKSPGYIPVSVRDTLGGLSEEAQGSYLPYECPVISCSSCDMGYCVDCNGDGICDSQGEMI